MCGNVLHNLFAKYYCNDQIEDRKYVTSIGEQKCKQSFDTKIRGKETTRKTWCNYDGNIKMNLEETQQ